MVDRWAQLSNRASLVPEHQSHSLPEDQQDHFRNSKRIRIAVLCKREFLRSNMETSQNAAHYWQNAPSSKIIIATIQLK